MEPFLGQILLVPYNFAPRGWALCNGQILSIAQNTALFSLLGTTYGGNGQTTFALPDLRGRVPVGSGQGPGLASYDLGAVAGTETVTLLTSEMPAHNHMVQASNGYSAATPENAFPGSDSATSIYDAAANTTMNPMMIGAAGGSQPHENRQPYQVLNYIIALEGIFPSRS
jgi:microcystin-dependent protein